MEAYHPGDLLSVIHSTMAMMLMCPALGMLYSGLTPHSSALSMAGMNLAALSMAVLQWVVWGYSLALSPTGASSWGIYDTQASTMWLWNHTPLLLDGYQDSRWPCLRACFCASRRSL